MAASIKTKLTVSDKLWITSVSLIKGQELGVEEICYIEAYSFKELTEAGGTKLSDFKQFIKSCEESQQWDYAKLSAYIAELKEFGIVITQSCSC